MRPASGFRSLPSTAQAVVAATTASAAALLVVVAVVHPVTAVARSTLALILAVGLGEAFRVQLPVRRSGSVLFTLSDAALTAGLLMLGPTEVVLGAAVGVALGQAPFPMAGVKRVFNVAQYTSSAAVAALTVSALGPPAGSELGPPAFLAVLVSLAAFCALSAGQVAAVVAATARVGWLSTVRGILPGSAVLTAANACLGLLAVVLLDGPVWALPALVAPLLLLYSASRQRVATQVNTERAAVFAGVQHGLAAAESPEQVAAELVEGTQRVLGLQAAVSLGGRWIGTNGSPPPPAALEVEAGPARLLAWEGEMTAAGNSQRWLERLGELGGQALERAASRNALEQERATLRAVVDGSGDGIFVLDHAGQVTEWNPAMGRLSGLTADVAAGRPVEELLGSGPWSRPGEHDVVRVAEGPHHRVVWRVAVASVAEGGRTLQIGLVHDVTAERRAARTKDDMLAIVSHELRSPLTPIKAGALTLLRRWDKLREDQRGRLLEQIAQQADHLTRLVEDLLFVGQTAVKDHARPAVEFRDVDLVALCRSIVEDSAHRHPDHLISFRAGPEVAAGLPAVSDPGRFRQILTNLVDNACKFSAPGTTASVTLVREDDTAVLTVADEGRGIHASDFARVFERFERIEDPDFMTTSGVGLGLHIVKALVTALGGEIGLRSTLMVGTTVTVRLPLRPPGAAHGEIDAADSARR